MRKWENGKMGKKEIDKETSKRANKETRKQETFQTSQAFKLKKICKKHGVGSGNPIL